MADRTMRIGLFYPHAKTPHIRSKKVRELVPDVFDLDVHRRLVSACEAGGLDCLFTLDNWGVESWGGHSVDASEARETGLMGPISTPSARGAGGAIW